jgi:hypothetical protein
MAAVTDLWGDLAPAEVRTPVAILREQAALLGSKTQNQVEASVRTEIVKGFGSQFRHTFNLVVPGLDNYTYRLFGIHHGVEMYPVNTDERMGLIDVELNTEEEFLEWLRNKLSSIETKRIISNLLGQVST